MHRGTGTNRSKLAEGGTGKFAKNARAADMHSMSDRGPWPFKPMKTELFDIIDVYAKVKSIRTPKKADGSDHQRFPFLDLSTKHRIVQSSHERRSVSLAFEYSEPSVSLFGIS